MSCRNPRLNASGCPDPTAFAAVGRVIRTERKKSQPAKVYICSPFKGDVETNTANAIRYCRFAVEKGYFPIAPHVYLPRFMDDDVPAERELALSFGLRLLGGCKAVWVFGEYVSEGMKREIAAAMKQGIQIKRFNAKMEEISL